MARRPLVLRRRLGRRRAARRGAERARRVERRGSGARRGRLLGEGPGGPRGEQRLGDLLGGLAHRALRRLLLQPRAARRGQRVRELLVLLLPVPARAEDV